MLEDHTPDRLEKQIRFGCGFVFGAVFGFFVALRAVADDVAVAIAIAAAVALASALLALRHGDRFWYSLRSWFDWW